jgi:hypothetical protein
MTSHWNALTFLQIVIQQIDIWPNAVGSNNDEENLEKWRGLYYKNIMIINDASKVLSVEHHLQSSITLIEFSIMLLESSNMLL